MSAFVLKFIKGKVNSFLIHENLMASMKIACLKDNW